MKIFDGFCWFITGWTLTEGLLVTLWPSGMIRLTALLFPRWGALASTFERSDLRKIGLIEFCFGLLLGGYLLWAT